MHVEKVGAPESTYRFSRSVASNDNSDRSLKLYDGKLVVATGLEAINRLS